jgi:ABC-type lipoprotein release transport system permease subunit
VLPLLGAALLLVAAAILASLIPAARAARVNVLEALRSD